MTNSRIQESRENFYYNSATEKKWKFANYKLRKKSQNPKFAKIQTRENYQIYSITNQCQTGWQFYANGYFELV